MRDDASERSDGAKMPFGSALVCPRVIGRDAELASLRRQVDAVVDAPNNDG